MICIEILYSDAAHLGGDLQNIEYLRKSCADIEVFEDKLNEEPYFLKKMPDLVYLGSTTEEGQAFIIDNLRPYREHLRKMIASGVYFLITGNAIEIFGKEIVDVDGTSIKGLDLMPIITERDMHNRYNALYLGTFDSGTEKMRIVGFKSQFGHSYWQTDDVCGWFTTDRGDGLNPQICAEGIRINNFMATYLIGPLLILNPPLAKWLLKELGAKNPTLAFERDAMAAYEARIREYSDPKCEIYYSRSNTFSVRSLVSANKAKSKR